jgi:hypothetical protein
MPLSHGTVGPEGVNSWTAGPGGSARPFGLRFVNYYTEVDPERTSLFSFFYWKTEGTWLHAMPRLAMPLFRRLVSAELERDKAIIEKVPRSEASLEWFQLSRFDGPLVATRKLMERHYPPAGDLRATCDPDTGDRPRTAFRIPASTPR